MAWVEFENRMAHVSWWPKDTRLHYAKLCCGIYEYLRAPPCLKHLAAAMQYLEILNQNPEAHMQRDRIRWTTEWIQATKAVFVG